MIKIGGKYRHFKGHVYKVIAIGKDCETLEDVVTYQSVDSENSCDNGTAGTIWLRPAKNWFDQIIRPGIDSPRCTEIAE
jgi:hypothetical protein